MEDIIVLVCSVIVGVHCLLRGCLCVCVCASPLIVCPLCVNLRYAWIKVCYLSLIGWMFTPLR